MKMRKFFVTTYFAFGNDRQDFQFLILVGLRRLETTEFVEFEEKEARTDFVNDAVFLSVFDSNRFAIVGLVNFIRGDWKRRQSNTKDFSLKTDVVRVRLGDANLVSLPFLRSEMQRSLSPCLFYPIRVFRKSLHRSCRFPRGKERCHSTTTSDWNLYFPVLEREKRRIRSSLHFLFFFFFLLKCQWLISPFRIDTFVEIHEDRVLWFENPVELTFHVSVSAQRFFDVTSSTPTRSKFDRFEPIDVL